jgi:predicted NAD/FAD-dependent oxidoreductase
MGEQGELVERANPAQAAPAAPGPTRRPDPRKETTVAVIGAGLAGLTAALRLAERGYKVTVYEEKPFLGGNFGAHDHTHGAKERTFHEHSYHMLLQWYHNFFALAADIGLDRDRDFEPRTSFKHLRKNEFPHMIELRSPGSANGLQHNLLSGLQPIPDMFLYSYSLIDLIGQQFDPDRLLDRYSVTGFMQSRPYATEGSTALHENTLAKAFASPSYMTSASSYQSFIRYGFRNPEPMLWILKGDSQQAFHEKLRARLESHGCEIKLLRRVVKIDVSAPYWEPAPLPGHVPVPVPADDKRVIRIVHKRVSRDDPDVMDCVLFPADAPLVVTSSLLQPPTVAVPVPSFDVGEPEQAEDQPDYVVLAVPPSQVASLLLFPAAAEYNVLRVLSGDFLEIAKIPRLRGAPMASLDLRFRRKLEGVPKEHVALVDSRFDLSFIDNSQVWPGIETTLLNVVASSFSELSQLNPGEAAAMIILELAKFLPFDPSKDVDWELSHFQPNVCDALFLNDVGSEQWRPTAKTPFLNLFFAGDYCRTFVDVVTLEGAVVSGLEAARQLQAQAIADRGWSPSDPRARSIGIVVPETTPLESILALKLLLAPHAVAAKWWSWADEQARALQRGDFSGTRAAQDLTAMGAAMVREPYRLAAEVWRAGWSTLFSLWAGGGVD